MDSKWQQSWPCFRNLQASVFNELDHELTAKLACFFIPFLFIGCVMLFFALGSPLMVIRCTLHSFGFPFDGVSCTPHSFGFPFDGASCTPLSFGFPFHGVSCTPHSLHFITSYYVMLGPNINASTMANYRYIHYAQILTSSVDSLKIVPY